MENFFTLKIQAPAEGKPPRAKMFCNYQSGYFRLFGLSAEEKVYLDAVYPDI